MAQFKLLKMEEMDDFGDLYADVEAHVSAGLESINHLHKEERKKNDDTDFKVGFHSKSPAKDLEVDSVSKELILNDKTCGCEANADDKKGIGEDLKTVGFKVGSENLIVEDGSDSEDDLHIVLNEDDCTVFPNSQGVSMDNGRRVVGSEDEDEDDDLVILLEADHSSKGQKLIDGFEPAMGHPSVERANASKCTYASQYSQFKHVRSHTATFNARSGGSAGAVSFSSPTSGRGDWDTYGSNQQKMSRSGLDTSSCNLGTPALSQNGFDFYLPRNRTILDVSIDAFDWKPWRHPGVDITDFFNFGLDEESWKSYCKSLEHFRQQTTMLTKIPVYESSRFNQVHDIEFLQKAMISEVLSGEIAQTGNGERVSSVSENVQWGARSLEMPKGKAIQVEGGTGERRPSIDVRRPRYRDSDVVIQIPMKDNTADSSVSDEEESEHMEDSPGKIFNNWDIGIQDDQRLQHRGTAHKDLNGFCHRKVKEHAPKETSEQLETVDGGDAENLSKVERTVLEDESTSDDQIQHNVTPSYLESHSEPSKAGVTVDMEKAYIHARKPSQSSAAASEHGQSNESSSDTNKSEPQDSKDHSGEQGLVQDDQNNHGRTRLHSMCELEVPLGIDKASSRAEKKDQYNGDHFRQGTRKMRQHNYNFDEDDSIDDKYYYRETEISIGYHGRRFSEKHERKSSCTEPFCRESDPNFQEQVGRYIRRDWDDREYLHDEKFAKKNDERNQRGFYFPEKGHGNGRMRDLTHKESDPLISEHTTFGVDKEECIWLRRKKDNGRRYRNAPEDDDFVLEHRYQEEFIQEKYRRHVLYYGKDEDPVLEKYGKRIPHLGRERELSGRREKDEGKPRFAIDNPWRSTENNGNYWRRPQDHREFHNSEGKGWCNSSSPRSRACDPWLPNNDMDDSYFVFNNKKHHYQSRHRRVINFDEDDLHAGMAVYCNDKRYSRQEADDEASLQYQDRDSSHGLEASFLLDRNTRHERCYVDNDSALDRKCLDDNWLGCRKKITVERSSVSKANKFISSTSDIADGGREGAVLRCKEPVNLHWNGWEGKVKLWKPNLSLTPCVTVNV